MSAHTEMSARAEISDQDEPSILRSHIVGNFKTLVPHGLIIYLECLEKKIEVSEWNYEPIQFKTYLSIHYWQGDRVFKVALEIMLSYTPDFELINTANCRGDKCRRDRDKTIDYWCTACHCDPCDMDLSDLAIFMLKNADEDEDLTFSHIEPYIDSCKITSLDEIFTLDVKVQRAKDIIAGVKRREAKILALSAQLDKLREEFDSVHSVYDFESKEKLDKFLVETHEKQVQALLEQVTQKMV
jgi:hypothetical protein